MSAVPDTFFVSWKRLAHRTGQRQLFGIFILAKLAVRRFKPSAVLLDIAFILSYDVYISI